MRWLITWFFISLMIRFVILPTALENGFNPGDIETSLGRYFFIGMLFPVIGDVVAVCVAMYYGMRWAAKGKDSI